MKGLALLVARRKADLTQWQLGVRAGIPSYRISSIECGRIEPRADEVVRLRAALKQERDAA